MADTKRILVVEDDAEYVESAAISERMAEIGVDHVQGYGVGRPEPIGEMGGMEALRALGS